MNECKSENMGEKSRTIEKRMQDGMALAQKFLAGKKLFFSALKPSELPAEAGVYAIFHKESGKALYVGRTKNLRQRLYNNHLHGPTTNARLKKYLIEDPTETDICDLEAAKQYLKDYCYAQFSIEQNLLVRGQLEGLLSYLLDVRYLYEEH